MQKVIVSKYRNKSLRVTINLLLGTSLDTRYSNVNTWHQIKLLPPMASDLDGGAKLTSLHKKKMLSPKTSGFLPKF